ncbi:MAG: YciI family protein [Moheibacter sp.]
MKTKNVLFFLFLFSSLGFAQTEISNSKFDKALADSLQADVYGMKSYVFVVLKTGKIMIDDKDKVNELFRGHLDNIKRLAKENKLVVAGPFGENENQYRGLFILNVKTIEEAQKLVETDPAINSGLLDVDFYEWYGSAALPMYLETVEKITKENF